MQLEWRKGPTKIHAVQVATKLCVCVCVFCTLKFLETASTCRAAILFFEFLSMLEDVQHALFPPETLIVLICCCWFFFLIEAILDCKCMVVLNVWKKWLTLWSFILFPLGWLPPQPCSFNDKWEGYQLTASCTVKSAWNWEIRLCSFHWSH